MFTLLSILGWFRICLNENLLFMLSKECNYSRCRDISFPKLRRNCSLLVDLCHTNSWKRVLRIRRTKPMKTNKLRMNRECLVNNCAYGSWLARESFELPKTYQ